MDKLEERIDYLIRQDLIPSSLHFLRSQRARNHKVRPRGVLLIGKKYARRVMEAFEQNKDFENEGFTVRKMPREEQIKTQQGRWYTVHLDEYFKIYLDPKTSPPTSELGSLDYD